MDTTTAPLDIKVIYSASSRRRPRRWAGSHPARGGVWLWSLVGAANLLAACCLYYGTWWRVDPFLYQTSVLRTPLPGVNLDAAAAGLLGPAFATATGRSAGAAAPLTSVPRPEDQTRATIVGATMYTWLTLTSLAAGLLAFAGGGALGGAGAARLRHIWMVLAGVVALVLGWALYDLWGRYGWKYPPNHWRVGMGAVVAFCGLLGLMRDRAPLRLCRLAAVVLIVSAVASSVGLYIGSRFEMLQSEHASMAFLATVFVVHSAYGWLLLIGCARLGR